MLFDATGTLMRPYPSVGAVYAAVAAEHGSSASPAGLEEGFPAAWRERAPVRFSDGPACRTSDAREKAWWRQTVRRTFEHAGRPDPGDACFEALFARFADAASWRLFPDAQAALARLRRAGLRLGIVSNFDSRLYHICDGLGLTGAVDFVLASATIGHGKPARELFQAAVRAAGAPPSRTLMVGDSPDDDIAGARAAGLQALLLDRAGRRNGPDVIHSLTDLPLLLGL